MSKKELQILLNSLNVSASVYCLTGGFPNEAYCLNFDSYENVWQVYYSERGIKTGLTRFSSEGDACEYLYKILSSKE